MVLKRLQSKLKELIRAKNLSYLTLAESLEVSEATVKRLLNHDDVSFTRLTDLCEILEVGFYDLVELTKDHNQKLYEYTIKQENLLAGNLNIFLILRNLIIGKSLSEIEEFLGISQAELAKNLKEMESCGLIERHVNDRIRLLANFPFKWIEDGPLEKTYGPVLLQRIFQQAQQVGLNKRGESEACLVFEWGLSDKSHAQFVSELSSVFDKYKRVAEVDIKSLTKSFTPTSGMVAIGKYPMW
jgi:DNA-binding Xre family transcriptional regulator